VDEDFLIGPEGAHLNVSGISGMAAKTSSVQFTLKSLLTHKSEDKSVAVVMFNVKSKDLLYVDQRNPEAEREESQEMYDTLDIPAEPFRNARFFAPADPDDPNRADSQRQLDVERFEWDLNQMYRDIPSLFSSRDWDDRMEGVWYTIRDWIENNDILTYAQMLSWVDQVIDRAEQDDNIRTHGGHIATWGKMLSHLRRFPRSFEGLIDTGKEGDGIPWHELRDESVYVVDIQGLYDHGKRLVFGRAIRELSNRLESNETDLDAIVVFVDELNKFAPSGNIYTPLKKRLVNITARGRSIGLVLFGAQQFASDVEKEVVENSSTFLFGKTEENELRAPNYRGFSDEVKDKLKRLNQGRLLAKFAKFPQPIFLQFPYPPCLPGNEFEPEGQGQQNGVPISEDEFIGSLS